jgi:hypothetical protein
VLVLIHSSGAVWAGQWARRYVQTVSLYVNESLCS